MSSAALIDLLVHRLADLQATHCAHVASSTIIVYDHLITIDDEVRLPWAMHPWSLGKLLFLFNRYFGLTSVMYAITIGLFTTSLTDDVSSYPHSRCQAGSFSQLCASRATGVAVCVVSEIILLMRLYVLYLLNKKVLVVMLVGFVIASGFAAAIMGVVMQNVTATVVTLPGLRSMCVPHNISSRFYTFWIPFLGFESLLCALALYRGFQTFRMDKSVYTSSRLLIRVLIRDSVLYYLAFPSNTDIYHSVFAAYFTNMLMWMAAPASLLELPIGFAVAMSCVLGNRMMFNIRQASHETTCAKLPMRAPSVASRVRYSTPPIPRFTREVVTVRDGSVHREICFEVSDKAVPPYGSVIHLDTMRSSGSSAAACGPSSTT
ncbi:hypothetical protein BD626DRAFT_402746 [Schizophyllum amplum]|uniref:DUF6533 domain-containing protein n=1 Tax=Schizophyllum amplum TaxID=97359 RepID=A0A550CE83_9AGAR|nr:hypothetical protein BD626DRAFT_402746 [Auriculariopsis ampla]